MIAALCCQQSADVSRELRDRLRAISKPQVAIHPNLVWRLPVRLVILTQLSALPVPAYSVQAFVFGPVVFPASAWQLPNRRTRLFCSVPFDCFSSVGAVAAALNPLIAHQCRLPE